MRLLIKNAKIADAFSGRDGIFDIYIENEIITEIDRTLDYTNCEIIDAGGRMAFPGFVDMHCHLRDPGYEYKEDIETGTRSAAAGGFTSIACMPNTNPVIDNESVVKYITNKAKSDGLVNVYPIGSITKGLKGEELAEIGELKFAGVVAISDDGKPVMNPGLMKRAIQYASMFDTIVISHCEDLNLVDEGFMNEGYTSTILGLKGIPAAAEEVMVARDVLLAEYLGVPVHIAHVSTAGSVEIIRHAKGRRVKVTAETCPHYFALTDEAVNGYNTNAKVNPPLRSEKDIKAVLEGLADDTIDVIATDHAPHHIDEKRVEFAVASNGIVGFETAVPLSITYLVKKGILSYHKLVEKMALNPARILGLNKGILDEGRHADITIIDVDEEFTVDVDRFHSKSKNSPFGGFKLYGTVYYTIVGGRVVVREKEVI